MGMNRVGSRAVRFALVLAMGVTSAVNVAVTGAVVSNGPATCVSWAMIVFAAAVYTASGFCAVAGGAGVARAHAPRPVAPRTRSSQVNQRTFLLRLTTISISSVGEFTSGCSLSEFCNVVNRVCLVPCCTIEPCLVVSICLV